MTDELREVCRIGAPVVPSLTVRCPSCKGGGWRESGFAFGSNVDVGQACRPCAGSGRRWVDVPLAVAQINGGKS